MRPAEPTVSGWTHPDRLARPSAGSTGDGCCKHLLRRTKQASIDAFGLLPRLQRASPSLRSQGARVSRTAPPIAGSSATSGSGCRRRGASTWEKASKSRPVRVSSTDCGSTTAVWTEIAGVGCCAGGGLAASSCTQPRPRAVAAAPAPAQARPEASHRSCASAGATVSPSMPLRATASARKPLERISASIALTNWSRSERSSGTAMVCGTP
jgi:hypothetical protein